MKKPEEMMELAEKATSEPWAVYHAGSGKNEKYEITEYFIASKDDYDDLSIAADIIDPITEKPSQDNAEFIAASREFVPYASQRLIEAKAIIADLLSGQVQQMQMAIEKAEKWLKNES